jgi:hypothetical protein
MENFSSPSNNALDAEAFMTDTRTRKRLWDRRRLRQPVDNQTAGNAITVSSSQKSLEVQIENGELIVPVE